MLPLGLAVSSPSSQDGLHRGLTHYFVDVFAGSKDFIDVSAYPVTNELLLISDMLITDYSSIMFDYANLGRPIVLYTYDLEHYRQTRGMYFDIETHGPGAIVRDFPTLLDILRDKSFENEENMAQLRRFQNVFCAFDDGNATDNIVKRIFPVLFPTSNKSAAQTLFLTKDKG